MISEAFRESQPLTIGAELELQIVDSQTGELASGGLRILNACLEEGIAGVAGEFLLCTIEVKSDVCEDVTDLKDNLVQRLQAVTNIARSLGYDLAFGGSHPFARPKMSAVFPNARYEKILERQGWLAYQEAVFGLHIHIGVPSGNAAIGVINQTVEYLPHLLALSANSPFWQGVDTSFHSSRMRMFRPAASAGIPPHLKDWVVFGKYVRAMQNAGLIECLKDLYWDIRPQPKFGTVEFRICDMPSTLSSVFGLAALVRCLVAQRLSFIEENPEAAAGEDEVFWLACENKWLASRYGLETTFVRHPDSEKRTISDDTITLLDNLTDVARSLGESTYLRSVDPREGLESGAERQRKIFRQSGDWHAVVDDMRRHWLQELDDSRAPCGRLPFNQDGLQSPTQAHSPPSVT